jgi:hypothetical protein
MPGSTRRQLRLSPALVISVIALVFAMTGGAWAVTQHSAHQSKAKKGKRGPKGAPGAAGAQGPKGEPGAAGARGEEGKEGSPWTAGGTLPSGKTETGAWAAGEFSVASHDLIAVSFPIPLKSPPRTEYVNITGTPTANCRGSVDTPEAAPGVVCFYADGQGKATISIYGAHTSGVVLDVVTEANGYAFGTWAVTAP